MTDLIGKTAPITGAGRGIGQAIAIRLGRLGPNVVVNYSRDEAGTSETVMAVETTGSAATAIRADVSKPEEVEALFRTAQDRSKASTS